MKKTNFKLFFSMMILTALFSSNAFAEDGSIVLTNKVFKQVIKKDKDGNTTYDYIEPKTALPGDVMMYTISFENIGSNPAEGIVINDPIGRIVEGQCNVTIERPVSSPNAIGFVQVTIPHHKKGIRFMAMKCGFLLKVS